MLFPHPLWASSPETLTSIRAVGIWWEWAFVNKRWRNTILNQVTLLPTKQRNSIHPEQLYLKCQVAGISCLLQNLTFDPNLLSYPLIIFLLPIICKVNLTMKRYVSLLPLHLLLPAIPQLSLLPALFSLRSPANPPNSRL